jgi:hypothetical protein
MNKINPIYVSSTFKGLVSGLALSLLLTVTAANANDRMGKLFDSYSVGSSYSGSTSSGTVWTGGSFRGRWRQPNVDIISFQPPSVSFGCGGIDAFAGSFGMISGDQLVQVGRAVAQGAASYFFTLAVNTICSSCATVMENIKKTLENFNRLAQNACQNTNTALDSLISSGGLTANSSWGDTAIKKTGEWAAATGEISSLADMIHDKKSFEDGAGTENLEKATNSNVVFQSLKNIDPSHFGLLETFVSDFPGSDKRYKLASFLMSVMGTEVYSILDINESCGGGAPYTPGGDVSRSCRTPYSAGLSVRGLILGTGVQDTETLRFTEYKCSEEINDTECVKIIPQDGEIEPVLRFAQRMLRGGGNVGAGIFEKLQLRTSLHNDQVKFLNLMPIPYVKLKEIMDSVDIDDAAFMDYYAAQWAYFVTESIEDGINVIYRQVGNQSFDGKKLDLRNDFKAKYKSLQKDIAEIKESLTKDINIAQGNIGKQLALIELRRKVQGA